MPETAATIAVFLNLANNHSTQNMSLVDGLHLARVLSSAAVAAQPVTVVEDHTWRVQKALANPKVQEAFTKGQKILAIKEVRTETNCGLKEAKDAVEAAFPHGWSENRQHAIDAEASDRALAALREKLTETAPEHEFDYDADMWCYTCNEYH